MKYSLGKATPSLGLPSGSVVKNPLANAEDVGPILGLDPGSNGGGNGNPI